MPLSALLPIRKLLMLCILKKIAKNYNKDQIVVMNMCGRGDKDLPTIMPILDKKI